MTEEEMLKHPKLLLLTGMFLTFFVSSWLMVITRIPLAAAGFFASVVSYGALKETVENIREESENYRHFPPGLRRSLRLENEEEKAREAKAFEYLGFLKQEQEAEKALQELLEAQTRFAELEGSAFDALLKKLDDP